MVTYYILLPLLFTYARSFAYNSIPVMQHSSSSSLLTEYSKGGVQPVARKQKRTFRLEDSDSEEDLPTSEPTQGASLDDGSVANTSETASESGGITTQSESDSPETSSQWRPRRITRRHIMSKLYLSNDVIRVATLNRNGALYRTDYSPSPLCDYILRNHIDIIMLIDHRASDIKMVNHIRRMRESCAKDIEYTSVGPDLKGPTILAGAKSSRYKEVGGCAIIAIGKVSSTFQKSVVRDPTGAGTF